VGGPERTGANIKACKPSEYLTCRRFLHYCGADPPNFTIFAVTMAIPADEPIFDIALLSNISHETKGGSYQIRPLQRSDYDKKFLECMAELTWIGNYNEQDFNERYRWLATKGQGWYYCIVADNGSEIVATATLIVERKLSVFC
jgi:hypothetical protein